LTDAWAREKTLAVVRARLSSADAAALAAIGARLSEERAVAEAGALLETIEAEPRND